MGDNDKSSDNSTEERGEHIMAGHKTPLAMDPALVKHANMHANRHKYFRWTRRTAGVTFAYVVAFPAFIGYLGYITDGKWQMRGKLRGDPIAEF